MASNIQLLNCFKSNNIYKGRLLTFKNNRILVSTELLKLVIIVKGLVNIEAKKTVLQQRPLVCQVEKSNV